MAGVGVGVAGEVELYFNMAQFSNPLCKLFQMHEFPHYRQIILPETGTWKTKALK